MKNDELGFMHFMFYVMAVLYYSLANLKKSGIPGKNLCSLDTAFPGNWEFFPVGNSHGTT